MFPWFSQRVLARCSDNSITHQDLLKQLSADRFVPYVTVLWWFGPALPCKCCIDHMLTCKKGVIEVMISMHNVAQACPQQTALPPPPLFPKLVHGRLLFHLAYIKVLCRGTSTRILLRHCSPKCTHCTKITLQKLFQAFAGQSRLHTVSKGSLCFMLPAALSLRQHQCASLHDTNLLKFCTTGIFQQCHATLHASVMWTSCHRISNIVQEAQKAGRGH